MKKLFILIIASVSFSTFATTPVNLQNFLTPVTSTQVCAQAVATTSPGFCPSFKSVAQCQCEKLSPRKDLCTNMDLIYSLMIARFITIERACDYQKDKEGGTDPQTCIDDWSCYRNGGKDSHGGLCSSTGSRCG